MVHQLPRFSRSLRAHTSLDRPVALANTATSQLSSSGKSHMKRGTLWKELKLFSERFGSQPLLKQLQRLWTSCQVLIGKFDAVFQIVSRIAFDDVNLVQELKNRLNLLMMLLYLSFKCFSMWTGCYLAIQQKCDQFSARFRNNQQTGYFRYLICNIFLMVYLFTFVWV